MPDLKRILVVDDEEKVCQSVRKILTREHRIIDHALSAKEALKMLEKDEYSVVVTDMMMPVMTGMELLEVVRRKWPAICVIMITGYATIRTAVQAIKLGAFDYIPKPFTPDELRSVVERALERHRLSVQEGLMREEPVPEEARVALEEKEAALPVEGEMYCIPEHSWMRIEEDGNVKVGIHEVFIRTCGAAVYVDLPLDGDEITQGAVCAKISCPGMQMHKVWAPVTGTVVEINSEVQDNPSVVSQDPYGAGWFIRVEPGALSNDLKNLVQMRG
ncbi:MAG: response regulator [bacterium]